jgi:hypothetical protein
MVRTKLLQFEVEVDKAVLHEQRPRKDLGQYRGR